MGSTGSTSGELGRDKKCNLYQYRIQNTFSSSKYIKEVFNVPGSLQKCYGQAFSIVTWQSSSRGLSLSGSRGHAEQLCRFEPWEPSAFLLFKFHFVLHTSGPIETKLGQILLGDSRNDIYFFIRVCKIDARAFWLVEIEIARNIFGETACAMEMSHG